MWDGKSWVDCRYLIRYIGSTQTPALARCSIYQHRLYAIIGNKQFCERRERIPYNFPGCPFNDARNKTHVKYLSAPSVLEINAKA